MDMPSSRCSQSIHRPGFGNSPARRGAAGTSRGNRVHGILLLSEMLNGPRHTDLAFDMSGNPIEKTRATYPTLTDDFLTRAIRELDAAKILPTIDDGN